MKDIGQKKRTKKAGWLALLRTLLNAPPFGYLDKYEDYEGYD